MSLHPITAALRRHKASVVLMVLQIALTLAIVSNAMFIIGQRIERTARPTGLDERDLLLIEQTWANAPSDDNQAGLDRLDAMQLEDLAALRALPDVAAVAPVNALPLIDEGSFNGIGLQADQKKSTTAAGYYSGDERMLATLGLRLTAGRNFDAAEIDHQGLADPRGIPVVIVTQPLADALFPHGDALGKVIYPRRGHVPATIIGVVERMQIPFLHMFAETYVWQSMLLPFRQNGSRSLYAVRVKPGRLSAALKAVGPALYAVHPMRILEDDGIRSFAEIRAAAYRADLGMAVVMIAICVILLAVTAAGIVGLATSWVHQRREQIGVRRALGARRVDILRYFQLENLFITAGGAVVGAALAIGLNAGLMRHYEVARLPWVDLLIGVIVVLALGQIAVFVPARRASLVPPMVATRTL